MGIEEKCFAAFFAGAGVLLGVVLFLAIASIAVAIWQAGFATALVCGAAMAVFFYASRSLYRAIIKNEWLT